MVTHDDARPAAPRPAASARTVPATLEEAAHRIAALEDDLIQVEGDLAELARRLDPLVNALEHRFGHTQLRGIAPPLRAHLRWVTQRLGRARAIADSPVQTPEN